MGKTKYITEVLQEINDDPSLLTTTYKKVGEGGPLRILFDHAFTTSSRVLLPDGSPPFKKRAEPLGMTPSHMMMEIKRFYVLCRTDLESTKRERVFIGMLESMHPHEAKIMLAIKEQQLTKLYPNITFDLIAEAGFIKKRRGRPTKAAIKKAEAAAAILAKNDSGSESVSEELGDELPSPEDLGKLDGPSPTP